VRNKRRSARDNLSQRVTESEAREAGIKFNAELLSTFMHAYGLRQRGQTEEGLKIVHDIHAANASVPKRVIIAHHRAIHSGCCACDKKVPLPVASTVFKEHITNELERVIKAVYHPRPKT